MILANLLILLISTIVSYYLLIKILPSLTFDIPNERSLHKNPIYRGGGIIFVLISFISIYFTKKYSLFLLIPLIAIGYLDDLFSIRPKIRYLIQFFTVFWILFFNFNLPINSSIIYLIILIFGTGIINFTNFIDGIDGLLTSNMIITFFHISFLNDNIKLYPLLGALIAFLWLNKSPAKVFMGDVGSTFLGAILFMEIIQLSNYKIAFLSFAGSLPIYMDAFTCVIARFINKENIFLSHKKHLYQRLVRNKQSHNKVTFLYSLSSILICFSCYSYDIRIVLFTVALVFFTGLFLNRFYACPFIKEND